VTGYGLNNLGTVFRFPAITRKLSSQLFKSGLELLNLLFQITGGTFLEGQKLGHEVDRWRTFSFELKNERNYTSNPLYAFVECIKATLLEFVACAVFVVALYHPLARHPYNYRYACQVTETAENCLFKAVEM
jgi:hypothetical protein